MSEVQEKPTQPMDQLPAAGDRRRQIIRQIAKEEIAANQRLFESLADA